MASTRLFTLPKSLTRPGLLRELSRTSSATTVLPSSCHPSSSSYSTTYNTPSTTLHTRLAGPTTTGLESRTARKGHHRLNSRITHGNTHCRTNSFATSASARSRQDVFLPNNIMQSPIPDLDIPSDVPFHRIIFDKCDEFKDKPALSEFLTGKTYTYSDVKEKTMRVASALSKRGYKKGDIILVFTPNQVDYTILMLACSCLGVWFSAANPAFTADDLTIQIQNSDSTAIFVHPVLAGIADKALEAGPNKIKERFVFGESTGYEPFSNLLEDDGKSFTEASIDPLKDVFALPYSSGTTGLPKGVMLSHHNIIANTLQTGGSYKYEVGDSVICILPLYHIYGMTVIQFGALINGAHLHMLPKFDPESFLACMQDRKVVTANLVPPLLLFMAKHPVIDKFDLSPLRSVISGAAPLGPELTEAFVKRFDNKVAVQQGYGLTETSPVTHIDIDCIYGSIGSLVANTKAKIVNTETGEICGPNEEGELCVQGPQVMLGYYKNDKATAEIIKEDDWLYSGDIGYYNEKGIFYISDRLKELIKYKGCQVAPAELEALLLGHPDVADVCVLGLPDDRAGELPKAFVVKKPGSSVTEENIIKFIDDQVTDFKRLRGGVEFIQEVPKNPSGKILRRLLKK